MSERTRDRLALARSLAYSTVAAVIVLSGLVMLGWSFDVAVLRSVAPALVAMNPATAVGFLLASLALGLMIREPVSRRRYRVAAICAGAVLLLGLCRLGGIVSAWDLGVDQLLFRTKLLADGPNRMAPNTAWNFVMVGVALVLLDSRRGRHPAQILVVASAVISLLALIGYLFAVESLYGIASFIPMAANTALAFLLLSIGILLARPDRGVMGLITADGVGSALARRLLPAAVGLPLLFGALIESGEFLELYGARNDTAYFVTAVIVAFFIVICRASVAANHADLERRAAADSLALRTQELVRSEQSLHRESRTLELILQSIGDGVVVADETGQFIVFNPAAERILGIGQSDVDPGDWTHTYGCYLPDMVTPYPASDLPLARAMRGESVAATEVFIRHAGKPEGRWLDVTAQPLEDDSGALRGGVAAFRDVTAQKRATAQLEAANKELEAFSYSVSHDLRAPLRSIDGFSQALVEDYSERLDGAGKEYLRRIRAATQRMGQLIDDLLNLSRVSRGELSRERVNLSDLASSIARDLSQHDGARHVEFTIAPDAVATGDPRLLRVALENLLGNAWKFTGKREQAQIEFGIQRDGAAAEYFVRDNGAGFDMAYAGKLFGAFQRLHGMTEFTGTGIGLATVQRIIHRHGGRVRAEAAVDHGATFYFTL